MSEVLLFHTQHFLGIGHLMRSLALADALTEFFRVVLLVGGSLPEQIAVPKRVELVRLPALRLDTESQLVPLEPGLSLSETFEARRSILFDALERTRPRVVLLEFFPFGRKKLSGELIQLLEHIRASGAGRPLVATSLRDLLVTGRKEQTRHDLRAQELLSELIDLLLVHADPRFVRLERSFRPPRRLDVPVHYTGFVAPPESQDAPVPATSPNTVVVSAGGGWVAAPFLKAALDAQPLLWREHRLESLVVAGPLVPDADWDELHQRAAGQPGLRLVRSVPALLPWLRGAAASLSQCGYNTTMDLLRARIPAVVVPFGGARENEQAQRAERLATLGFARAVHPDHADGPTLARAVTAAMAAPLPDLHLDLDGAKKSARILAESVGLAGGTRLSLDCPAPDAWLEPLRRTLAAASRPRIFFFRDDDVGWAGDRLALLLERFEGYRIPLDLAVIPEAMDEVAAADLRRRIEARPNLLAVHQHGYAHLNHEPPTQRKWEFGPARDPERQQCDLHLGQEKLRGLFGDHLAPIFTPPWNRCTADTARELPGLGIRILSRDAGEPRFDLPELSELPISVNWLGRRYGVPRTRSELGERLAEATREDDAIGIMLHHEEMDSSHLENLDALLSLLARAPNACCVSMQEAVEKQELSVREASEA